MLDLDNDMTTSTDGIEEVEIGWFGIDTVPELLDSVLTSNGTHPNSIADALREATNNGTTHQTISFYLLSS